MIEPFTVDTKPREQHICKTCKWFTWSWVMENDEIIKRGYCDNLQGEIYRRKYDIYGCKKWEKKK